jgi:cyclic pyranopterin phosphate synthase
MIKDSFGRIHNYLRISLTDNCNLRCFYCMPDEKYDFAPASKLMQPGEIETLAKLFVSQGVTKIRLTGGEPLVRKDAPDIVNRLAALPVNLAITTNAVRINEMLPQIIAAGFSQINISLDTLQAERFRKITHRDYFARVRANIDLLLSNNIIPKINVVVMKGLNDDEINDFVAWTRDMPIQVRFIEFMPFSGNRWTSNQVFTLHDILSEIAGKYDFMPVPGEPHDTAKHFQPEGHKGSFAVISTMSEPFCDSCNRMRLTADGKLKNCLFSKEETDLLNPLREGQDLLPLIHESIGKKARALGGQFSGLFSDIDPAAIDNRSMITIGG